MFRERIELKTPEQIDVMRRAGLVVESTLRLLRESAAPGMTTGDLDRLARENIASHGATSNFLHYGAHAGDRGFPGVICTSVNDEVVHGIPGDRVLLDGDLLSIDCGAIVDGWHGDSALTIAIGEVDAAQTDLMRVTEQALWDGIAAARLGGRVGDISAAIEQSITTAGSYGITDGFTGHGIGTAMHQPPFVPNVATSGRTARLVPGLVLAVEPMVTLGTDDSRTLADDWTVVTLDGSRAAHFEHTFTLTDTGTCVLSARDGGQARLAELGVPYGGPAVT